MTMSAEEQVRRERLQSLIDLNVEPYPAGSKRTVEARDFLQVFDDRLLDQKQETLAGRVLALRHIGALVFLRVHDFSGALQIVLRKDDIANYQQIVDHLDVGDIIEVTGVAYVTKTQEKSLLCQEFTLLAKALRPLPEKWHGLQDVETRYRQRELDLIANHDALERLLVRSKLVSAIRKFLDDAGFFEVETPILQAIPGGASAKPFVTHHNALNEEFYLRIAPELYLKRLVVGGLEKIYEMGRCFRNEGIDNSHNPEFTMLEIYQAYAKKNDFIAFIERMMHVSIAAAIGGTSVQLEGKNIDLAKPFLKKTFRQTIIESSGIDIDDLKNGEDVIRAAADRNIAVDFSGCVGYAEHLDALYKKTGRAAIVAPTWVFDYPVDLKPLARQNPEDNTKSACTQLVLAGDEIVNLYYYELNNPIDQRTRFSEQDRLREQGSEDAQFSDEDFLAALEYGMPPTSGVGIGIDRLVASITGAQNLKEVIAFPTLKSRVERGGATDESRS